MTLAACSGSPVAGLVAGVVLGVGGYFLAPLAASSPWVRGSGDHHIDRRILRVGFVLLGLVVIGGSIWAIATGACD